MTPYCLLIACYLLEGKVLVNPPYTHTHTQTDYFMLMHEVIFLSQRGCLCVCARIRVCKGSQILTSKGPSVIRCLLAAVPASFSAHVPHSSQNNRSITQLGGWGVGGLYFCIFICSCAVWRVHEDIKAHAYPMWLRVHTVAHTFIFIYFSVFSPAANVAHVWTWSFFFFLACKRVFVRQP